MSEAANSSVNLSDIEANAVCAVTGFMDEGERLIDEAFGDGHAKKAPALLAGYLQACALMYLTERLVGLDQIAAAVASAGDALSARLDLLDDAADTLRAADRCTVSATSKGRGPESLPREV